MAEQISKCMIELKVSSTVDDLQWCCVSVRICSHTRIASN